MAKKEVKKSIWKECWEKYVAFVKDAWENAWVSLKDALIIFVSAVFEWLKLICGAVFGGIWDLLILPLGKWCKKVVIEWIERI